MVPCFSFGECELVGRMWKACGGVTKLFSFSTSFSLSFFYILSLVSRRCGWGRSFNVWNSSFRSKNGELGRSVGIWNRLSAPWTCLFRQLKMVHGATQREPRQFYFGRERPRMPARRRLCSSSVRVHGQSTCTPKIGQFNVFNVSPHTPGSISARTPLGGSQLLRRPTAGKVGGGRIKQGGGEGGGGMDATCGRFRRISVRWLNVNVERVTEVDAERRPIPSLCRARRPSWRQLRSIQSRTIIPKCMYVTCTWREQFWE